MGAQTNTTQGTSKRLGREQAEGEATHRLQVSSLGWRVLQTSKTLCANVVGRPWPWRRRCLHLRRLLLFTFTLCSLRLLPFTLAAFMSALSYFILHTVRFVAVHCHSALHTTQTPQHSQLLSSLSLARSPLVHTMHDTIYCGPQKYTEYNTKKVSYLFFFFLLSQRE